MTTLPVSESEEYYVRKDFVKRNFPGKEFLTLKADKGDVALRYGLAVVIIIQVAICAARKSDNPGLHHPETTNYASAGVHKLRHCWNGDFSVSFVIRQTVIKRNIDVGSQY